MCQVVVNLLSFSNGIHLSLPCIHTDISKPFVETPQNATLRIYADHVMRCKPPVGYPNPTIEWWKDDKPLETDNRVTVTGSTNESEIHFSRITWRSRGKYQCIAVNSEGTRTSKAAFITIEGDYLSGRISISPNIDYEKCDSEISCHTLALYEIFLAQASEFQFS